MLSSDEELVKYHYEYDIRYPLSESDDERTIFDDLILLKTLSEDKIPAFVESKVICWLSMYEASFYSFFRVKLFLSLGVVLCRFNPCAFIALLDTLNNNDIDLLRYAQIEIADVLGGQVCHFTCQMDGGCPELVNASAITLSESIRLRCEQDVSFAPAGARYLRYLAYNGDTKTLLDVFSGCTYHNEVLAATFVDAMMDVRDDVALVDVASDLLFEMLFDGKQAERIMPDWKRMLLQRISAQQTRIDAALYFSPECSALRVVMESENFVSLIKAHELLSRVKPENLIGQVTSLQEILFVQDYFALDVQTTLLNIQEPSLKERYLCQLASSC